MFEWERHRPGPSAGRWPMLWPCGLWLVALVAGSAARWGDDEDAITGLCAGRQAFWPVFATSQPRDPMGCAVGCAVAGGLFSPYHLCAIQHRGDHVGRGAQAVRKNPPRAVAPKVPTRLPPLLHRRAVPPGRGTRSYKPWIRPTFRTARSTEHRSATPIERQRRFKSWARNRRCHIDRADLNLPASDIALAGARVWDNSQKQTARAQGRRSPWR